MDAGGTPLVPDLGPDLPRIKRLERHLQNVMAPETSWSLPGWRCFATAGGTIGRVSSAAADPDGAAAKPASVAEVARSYLERGYRPRLRLTPLAPPASSSQAAALGWTESSGALVMGMALPAATAVAASTPDGVSQSWSPRPEDDWCSAHLAGHEGSDAPARLALAAQAKGDTAYFQVSGTDDGELRAIGLGIVADGLLGIYDVLTLRQHRRAGHARRVMSALLTWGARAGATEAYLQVATGNEAATSLYRAIGFEAVYSYSYLAP